MKNRYSNYDYYDQPQVDSLKDIIELQNKRNHDGVAYIWRECKEEISKTFGEFYDDVTNLSSYFYKKYSKKNIAIIGPNSYYSIVLFYSIILSGNICVIIDKDLDKDKITELLKKSDSKIVYYDHKYCSFINEIKIKSFTLDEYKEHVDEGKLYVDKYKKKYKNDENKDACIFFTSGTTGANKGVVLSQKNIAADTYGSTSIFKLSGSTVNALPFHHTFGLITAGIFPFYYNKTTFINNSLRDITKDIKFMKPETLIVVPAFVETFYKQIWKTAKNTKKDKILKSSIKVSNALLKIGIDVRSKLFKSLHDQFGGKLSYIICGGAYLDKKYVEWFRSIGIEILNGYGITECSPVVSVNRNEFHRDGSVGQICRGVNVSIIDDEICVSGPTVMKGYYKDKKANKEVLIDGVFHTGDLGYLDDDGFLFITGRKKNLIILSNGENISPEVVESALYHDKAVAECVVYENDNRMVACIYPVEEYLGNQEYFDELIAQYNQDKPKNQQIAYVELRTEEFVKNNNKKIMRNKIHE